MIKRKKKKNEALRRLVTLIAVAPAALLGLAGALYAAWQALAYYRTMREMPVHEETRRRPPRAEPPPEAEIPAEARGGTPVQFKDDGEGMLYHRRYSVDIASPTLTPESLMAEMMRDPNRFSPALLAHFEKTKGEEGRMEVGDEFMIHISGPWNGPVRVIKVEPTEFHLVTLEGHLEAGEIHFRAAPHPTIADGIRFEILSWARSKDRAVHLAYAVTGVAKAAQTNMWAHWCREVVKASGGELIGEIEIVTEERPLEEEEEGAEGGEG